MGLLSGNMIGQLIEGGLKATRSMILLGGTHTSWRSNDLGLPVGVGLSNPGLAHFEVEQMQTSVKVRADLMLQTTSYLVAFNPLGVSQGIMKMRGSRVHIPANALIGFSTSEKQVTLKVDTPSKEKPLSILFSSKTVAFLYGREPEKALKYLKESCSECLPVALVTRGEQYRKTTSSATVKTSAWVWNPTSRSTIAKATRERAPSATSSLNRSNLRKSTRTEASPGSPSWASCKCATTSTTTHRPPPAP